MNKHNIMTTAWSLAREGAKKFGGKVREYFSAALRMAWEACKKPVNVVAALLAIGGNEWVKGANHRIYFNAPKKFSSLQIVRDGLAFVSATLAGEEISKRQAQWAESALTVGAVFFDVKAGVFSRDAAMLDYVGDDVIANIKKAAGI